MLYMLPQVGFFSLIIALSFAISQFFFPLFGILFKQEAYLRISKVLTLGQFIFILLSMMILLYLLLTDDFSVAYVVSNSQKSLPIMYKFGALWGANEGSILLWEFILVLWSLVFALFERKLAIKILAKVLGVLAFISSGTLLYIIQYANPFVQIFSLNRVKGIGLNPLLQDYGITIHPPIMYLGYVGFAVVFAIILAALIEGRLDIEIIKLLKKYTLLAWSFLGLGVILGCWWAYRVLGWGGWWSWDPVENLSLLPWLVGIALIHSLMATEKNNTFKLWTIFLSLITFPLSMFGTFLTRSGMLVSSHAFSQGLTSSVIYLLSFVLITVMIAFIIFAIRGGKITSAIITFSLSKETLLIFGSIIIFTFMLTVALGTIYPIFVNVLQWGKISVGPPYFNIILLPFVLPVLLLLGITPFVPWGKIKNTKLIIFFALNFIISLIITIIILSINNEKYNTLVFLELTFGIFVFIMTIQAIIKKIKWLKSNSMGVISNLGGPVSHFGFAVLTIAVIVNVNFGIKKELNLSAGDTIHIQNYIITYTGLDKLIGPNYTGVTGKFVIANNPNETLMPQIRSFPSQDYAVSIPDMKSSIVSDLYIAMGNPVANDKRSVKIYYQPLIKLIWLGGIIIALGGFLSVPRLINRRKKRGRK